MKTNKSSLSALAHLQRFLGLILNLLAIIFAFELFSNLLDKRFFNFDKITLFAVIVLIIQTLVYLFSRKWKIRSILNISSDLLFIILALGLKDSQRVFEFYLVGRQSYFIIRNLSGIEHNKTLFDTLSNHPPIFFLFSFLLTIFAGTLLLLLPAATVQGSTTSVIDALFTSTSATCVTGLIVQDTGTHFTHFGQMIILLLLQIGGLGIMTISSAFAIIIGQKLTVRSENLIQNVVGESNKDGMTKLVKSIVFLTIIIEFIGTILLFFVLKNNFSNPRKTLYYSAFHSVSAFCNAGFSLFSDSLMKFHSMFSMNFIITSLIILGGLGFPVFNDLSQNLKKKFSFSRFSLHTKIVLITTLLLLTIGFLGFFISEYNHTMDNFSLKDRILASYFQSVTTRTAGFNTIDNAELSPPSVLVSVILMFIGASPGSTGGGIKTTTFMIIFLSVLAMLSGNKDVNIFKRKVADNIIKKVMALIAISIFFLSFMIFLLLITETRILQEPNSTEKIIFEAFSAFGTVGLSMGITPILSTFGKIIIIFLMYVGRVGPLTLLFAISETKLKSSYTYTEEKISIG